MQIQLISYILLWRFQDILILVSKWHMTNLVGIDTKMMRIYISLRFQLFLFTLFLIPKWRSMIWT